MTDQQRADHLGCAGNPLLRTPHIDRIAHTGVHLSRAHVNNPLCMPCRSTLFTGQTPRGHGVRTNGMRLDAAVPTMTAALAEAGYRTHAIGKLHLSYFGLPKGADPDSLDPAAFPESAHMWASGKLKALPTPYYGLQSALFVGGHGPGTYGEYLKWLRTEHPEAERLLQRDAGQPTATGCEQAWKMALPEELHPSTWIADRAIEFLDEQARSGGPFFFWCSFPDPHHPYVPPAPWSGMYDLADVALPTRREGELADLPAHYQKVFDEGMPLSGRFGPTRMRDDQIREIIALTYGMIGLVDKNVGRVLDALERLGLRGNTVVVYLSDHGDMMGDHWIINKGPFHFNGLLNIPFLWSWPGHFREGLQTPALASFLDFAPTILDLASVPIPEGPVPPERETPNEFAPWPGVSLAPLLRGEVGSMREAVLVESDEDYLGLRLRTLVTNTHKITAYPGRPYGELFDLQNDPGELHNLWDDPSSRSLRADLLARLMEEIVLTEPALPRRMCHA